MPDPLPQIKQPMAAMQAALPFHPLHQRRERVDYDLFLESQPRSSTR
jgi:hypothetical protein